PERQLPNAPRASIAPCWIAWRWIYPSETPLAYARPRSMSSTKAPRVLRAVLSRKPWLPCLLSAVSVLATVAFMTGIFVRAMLAGNHGRVGAPIDDAYIYFNYARNLAAGHFFEYNPGDGMSTGATSFLWTAVLACGYRIGFRGDRIVWLALGLG